MGHWKENHLELKIQGKMVYLTCALRAPTSQDVFHQQKQNKYKKQKKPHNLRCHNPGAA